MSSEVPGWLVELAERASRPPEGGPVLPPPPPGARPGAVLVLFGSGPDVLLIQRSPALRHHPGQPAFPGGATEAADADPAATAVREAAEETGLDPAGVEVLATLPPVYLRPSRFAVAPVLAWWRKPCELAPDLTEVTAVARVPLAELAEPANRLKVVNQRGWVGPGFRVRGLLVWGFTAALLDTLLSRGGLLPPAPPGTPVVAAPLDPGAPPGPLDPGASRLGA